MRITPEKELMLKALETLISEACQDGFNSSTSVASMVIKGFGLKQNEFLEYFGFHFVNVKCFSIFSNILYNLKLCLTRDNWFYHKTTIVVNSTDDIYKIIGMYRVLSKYLAYTKHRKYFPASLNIHVLLSSNFIINNEIQDVFVDYTSFSNLKVVFNKQIDDLNKHLIITKAFEEKYSQYFDRMTISWINRE